MTLTSLSSRFDGWQGGAPWAEWSMRRRLVVGVIFSFAAVVGAFAFFGAVTTSVCGLGGGQCTPEEDREIRIWSTIFWGTYFFSVAGFVVMFLLRRRVFWAVAAGLGVIGLVDVIH